MKPSADLLKEEEERQNPEGLVSQTLGIEAADRAVLDHEEALSRT
jgi:hypothetical protein